MLNHILLALTLLLTPGGDDRLILHKTKAKPIACPPPVKFKKVKAIATAHSAHLTAYSARSTQHAALVKPYQPKEADYYQMINMAAPDGVVMEVGGTTLMPDGRLALCTRRGEVWMVTNPSGIGGRPPVYKLFATGLHEPLGINTYNNRVYVVQRGELTKLIDTDQDQVADRYETVCRLPLSANYHEYGYGPVFDNDGNAFVTMNVGFFDPKWYLGVARVPWRGWTVKINTETGVLEPFATGMRSPAGIYRTSKGDIIYGENQGDYVGSGWITEVNKGDFVGHPAGLDWADQPGSPVKARYVMVDSAAMGKPMLSAKGTIPGLKMPAVWFPQGIMGVSTCGIVELRNDSTFGPFGGQFLIGDQGQSKVMRMTLERVKGVLQGACYDFRKGFQSGVLRMSQDQDGQVYVGQTNRGWSSEGPEPFALQRLKWRGAIPFEMKAITARPDGFDLELTQAIDKKTAQSFDSYAVTSFTYKYHPTYGSPVINERRHPVQVVKLSDDGLHVRLVVDSLREGYIHEIKADGLTNERGQTLLHNVGYYTLNAIPDGEKIAHTTRKEVRKVTVAPSIDAKTVVAAAKAKPGVAKALPRHLNKMPAGWGKPDITLSLTTKPGLKFEPSQLTVRPGAKVKLSFANPDDMLHNFVLVQPGDAMEVGAAALSLGLQGMKMSYIPKTNKVIAHTLVLQPQSNEVIYFVAPTKPGNYQYVCTLPGHYVSMQGVLVVR